MCLEVLGIFSRDNDEDAWPFLDLYGRASRDSRSTGSPLRGLCAFRSGKRRRNSDLTQPF